MAHLETDVFDAWLKRELMRREMTQADLARRMEISPMTISNWIRGERVPTAASCYAIADALDLPPRQVLERAGHPVEEDGDESEERLVALWRKLTPDAQDAVMRFVEFQRERER